MKKKFVKSIVAAAAITVAAAAPALAVTESVGGGTWNHGYQKNAFNNSSDVYSNYYHPRNHHTGTSICGSQNRTGSAGAGAWANSSASCSYFDSTAAYWNNV